jgi:hypothetical protein
MDLSIDMLRKNGCAILRFTLVYGDLVQWFEGECTNINVDYGTMSNNLEDLRTVEMPPGYPKVDLDQTRETLKEGVLTKGNFVSHFEHALYRSLYDNHQSMYDSVDAMMEKLKKEEEKSYHLCFSRSFLYFTQA